jgi:hypothetical protein
MENIFFGLGRHYIDDILVSRLSRDSTTGDLSELRENMENNIPRPVNDILGQYIETNISLLTENRPRPRVTAKSSDRKDKKAAELSELNVEYLWEALDMPEKHREMVRLMLYCGVVWLEVVYDHLEPRYMTTPPIEEVGTATLPGVGQVELQRTATATSEEETEFRVEYGDITARVVSPFEMHLPVSHWWNGDEMGWIMREYYVPMDVLKDKWLNPKVSHIVKKSNGWYRENIDRVGGYNVQNLPLWWWERLSDVVEGPGPSIYVGTPETWDGYTVVRVFDRKPNPKWPRGRTVIIAGEQVIYDSPKKVGARAFDPRWPHRWHPYTRYRWEAQPGSMYGRSLVSKILPFLKRINSIDTTLIMWRRTVPIATWLVPKGANPVEDLFSGRPGMFWEYDPRRTMQQEPKPIFPPSYPAAALEERNMMFQQIEAVAGTEDILRGERPTGVNSALMLDALRKQALAAKSPILQAWDESLQTTGIALLQETIKYGRIDPLYAERLRILAREKFSRVTIDNFNAKTDLSDNVNVRIDTASMAMVSREAKTQRALEFIQYSPAFIQLPLTLRESLLDYLGFEADLRPQGPDINRAKDMVSWIEHGNHDLVIPFPEDNPYVFHEILVNKSKEESFIDWSEPSQVKLLEMMDLYQQQVELLEKQQIQMQNQLGAMAAGLEPPAGGKG